MTDTNARAALAARQERIAGETWCVECKQVRTIPCRYALCPLQARASDPRPATGHIPFAGHRTVAEVMAEAREEQVRRAIRRGLGR